MKYVLVQIDDGSVLDINEKHLAATLKRHPTWTVIETGFKMTDSALNPPFSKEEGRCVICGSTEHLEHP